MTCNFVEAENFSSSTHLDNFFYFKLENGTFFNPKKKISKTFDTLSAAIIYPNLATTLL